MQDEGKRNPFTSSPPHGDVCLFVWRSIRGGEDESRKKRRLVQPPLHLQTCLSFYGAEGGREEDLFILRVL